MSTSLIVVGSIALATFGDQYEPRSSPSSSFVQLLVSILFSNISAHKIYMFLICALKNIGTYVTNHNCTLIKYHILYAQCKCTLIKLYIYICIISVHLSICYISVNIAAYILTLISHINLRTSPPFYLLLIVNLSLEK
jgi:hypothetical protein